jgi:hypothetical protein
MSYENMGFEEGAIAGAGVEIYGPKILEEPLLKKVGAITRVGAEIYGPKILGEPLLKKVGALKMDYRWLLLKVVGEIFFPSY